MGGKKKAIWKRWWFWVVAVVIVIAVATPSATKNEGTNSAQSGSFSAEGQTNSSQTSSAPQDPVQNQVVDDATLGEKNALEKAEILSQLFCFFGLWLA